MHRKDGSDRELHIAAWVEQNLAFWYVNIYLFEILCPVQGWHDSLTP